ncbi:DNA helicase MCM8 [Fistulifera solaris]|uniref:DNA helicase n=1 Tax=Fistulifera solaris TaxID=1519565 RepID=A0A1Z5KSI3_FISSO|nr:DNA helicase MCM8 [Fistulifera solaris]|eukprot:GAX29266.1 DNA helicase MCM8 [Fistulifera solaris]
MSSNFDEIPKDITLRLWRACNRQLVGVPTHVESKVTRVPPNAMAFISRLYSFFRFVLQKEVVPSCFQEYAQLGIKTGRIVLSLHHQEFMDELHDFELRGQAPTQEYIQKESFGAFLYHMSEEALPALGVSMALACGVGKNVPEEYWDTVQIIVRFLHVLPLVNMMDIRTGLVGKFISLQGHVLKARSKRLRVATADFICSKCAHTLTHSLPQGQYSLPTSCCPQCKGRKTFSLQRATARYIDVQELKLQEAADERTIQAGRTPRQMAVEVEHDLVNACRAGDVVQMVCTVAALKSDASKRRKESGSTYELFLRGHSVSSLSESQQNSNMHTVVYTQQQLQAITSLCHADHRYFGLPERRAFPFDLLVRSLCPAIIGHHHVKAGILLCLLGGTPTNGIRSNSHILIVGDPGMGKSQMLLAARQLAARSVYVGGNTSSTTGLTVTLTKEERGETGIEAGALVLADQGICCIDEFDKMNKSHQDGLLEAMEQQQVSIAKAGVVASLPARCSIVAAANPRHGSYSMNKSVSENLNMAKPILSRFDLVFILRDRADQSQDRLVSSNIMNLYRKDQSNSASWTASAQETNLPDTVKAVDGRVLPLSERLAWVSEFQKQPLPATLVRDYIAYAREYCKPKMTKEAAEVLKDYFMQLRYPAGGRRNCDSVPITTRQLEALIRLCQARAKACLREYCLKEDALDVVELLSTSVDQVHSDDNGRLDRGRGGAGGISNRKMKTSFKKELQLIFGPGGHCTMDDLRKIADKVGCGLSEFPSVVDELRGNGILMKKTDGSFQVIS